MLFLLLSSFCYSNSIKELIRNDHRSLNPISSQKLAKAYEHEDLMLTEVTGNYANTAYVNNNKVPNNRFTVISSGDQDGHPISLSYDGNDKTFWASSVVVTETTKSYLTYQFTSITCLEGLIYGPAYSTNQNANPKTRRYDGFPTVLNIYSSSKGEDFQLRYTFRGYPAPENVWHRVQLIFSEEIWCDKLKLEFVEVTRDVSFGNDFTAACAELILMSPQSDYTRVTTIRATGDYDNVAYLNSNKVPTSSFTYFSPGESSEGPTSKAFDGQANSYWITTIPNSNTFKNYITINFNSLTSLQSIVYSMAYSTDRSVTPNTRRYDGYPNVLKVFTSINEEPFKLNHVFTGGPTNLDLWDRVQFAFSQPIWCDKLKLEFTDLTLNVPKGNDYTIYCGELFLMPAQTVVPTPSPAAIPSSDFISALQKQATDDYANNNIVNAKKVPNSDFTYSASGDYNNTYRLSNLFDNTNSFWVSLNENNDTFKNYVMINFNKLTYLEAILFNSAYSTSGATRRYDGYPLTLTVYTSSNGDPLKKNHVFTGAPTSTQKWDRTAFVFKEPIWCDKLKIEFTEITILQMLNLGYRVFANDFFFIKATPVATPTRSALATQSPTPSQSPTASPSQSPSASQSPTASPSQSPTASPSQSPTASPSQSPSASQSPTASQSPSQSPTPARTSHPGSTDDVYINKNYATTIPSSDNNQIQLGGSNQIKQISGCKFTDLNINNRVFFIKVNGPSSIFDNVFEFTSYTTNKAGCIWYKYSNANKFIISNCKFRKISGKDGDASVLNVDVSTLANIEFRDCEFTDCGEINNDRPIVNILHTESTIEFNNCYFSYENPSKSRVLEIKGNGATFDNCRFEKCGENCIDLGIEEATITTHKAFQFTNNYVRSVNTRFIRAPRIKAKPTIKNNIFEECTLNGEYFIYIKHNQAEIELNNNTFSNIKSQGNDNGNCGGLSIFVERDGSKFKMLYKECHFINIHNEKTTHPNNQGGALQYFSNENFEVDIEISNCEFKNNKAYQHGGAISIQTTGTVLINNCVFESNEANYRTAASHLLYENYYDKKTNGYGGAIYLNPTFNNNGQDYQSQSITISGCTFTKNSGYQGFAIYIEGEKSTTTYSFTSNTFNNNHGNSDSPATNAIIATEDLSITIEKIGNTNTFNNNELGSESERFMRVDHKGNYLPEGDYSYDDNNFAKPDPDDRIEKVLDISSVDDASVKVTVAVSTISNKVNDDGGAIHIVNCALECTGTTFNTCTSEKGGGGGIYIENTGGKTNTANLVGLTFNGCQAEYGGAVYIYSNSYQNQVKINFCTFIGNRATKTAASGNSDSKFFGGSAIFLTAKGGQLSSNIFRDNEGDGGAVKIYNKFDKDGTRIAKNNMKLKDNNSGTLLISDCKFEMGKNADCCLFYLRGNNGAKVELQKCSFTGTLPSGSHYIDGKSLSKDGPKLFVKKCKFAYDSANSLNMKDYLSIDLNDQSFVFDKSNSAKKKISLSTWMIIAAGCVAVAIVVVCIIIFVVKRKNPNNIEENEMSTEVRNLLLNDNSSENVVNSSLI